MCIVFEIEVSPVLSRSLSNRPDFSLPQCDNNSEDVSFEPSISSEQKLAQSIFEITEQKRETKMPLDRDIESSQDQLIKIKNKKWGTKGLRIMFFMTKFVKQMKNHSTQVKFKSLNANILKLISDAASDSDVLLQKHMNKIQILIQNLKWALSHIPIMDPDSNFKVMWDILLLIQIILNIFYIPMKIGFGFQNEGILYQLFFESLPSWTFIVDIIINFFTAYYSKGQIHKSHKDIIRNYARYELWWDLLIAIPFILSSFKIKYTEYILMLRLAKVKTLINSVEEAINPSITMQTVLELFKSVFLLLFVSHCCACLWNLIGQMQQDAGNYSWLDSKGIVDAQWDSRYIHSLYFTTVTTLTVGYGDIVPQSDLERIFVILMAMVICGLFGYTISSIGNILRQLTEKEQIYKQKMTQLNNYVKKRQLSKQLILSVRKYFEYYLKMQDENTEFGENMMNALNKKLKEQVAIDLYHNTLMSSRLIKKTLSEKSVKKLCCYVREKRMAPEEIVEAQNELANKLFFLQKGQINLICDQANRETQLAVINAGKFIGEKEFIIQSRYDYSIRTTKFCQIAYIQYEDFFKIIKEDPIEEENYQMLKDEMLFNEEKQNYGEVCYICRWTHQFMKCPFVFYHVNLDRLRKRFMITEDNKRKRYKRYLNEKTRFDKQLLQESALQQIVDNNYIPLEDLTDQYLDTLGYVININQNNHMIKTLLSMKTSNTQNSSSQDSDEEDNQIHLINQSKSPNLEKKVQFLQISPESKEFGKQTSKFKRVRGSKRTFAKLSQIQNHRGSSISALSQDLSNLGQVLQQSSQSQNSYASQLQPQQICQPTQQMQMHHASISSRSRQLRKGNSNSYQNLDQQMTQLIKTQQQQSRSDLRQFSLSMIQETSNSKLEEISYKSRQRIDFDIDQCFNTKHYFVNFNLDIVLMKAKRPKKTQRHAAQILSVIEKSKIRQQQRL
ncbi:unnamed protein product (macronuclear) [Paramecium tetraurelia]|uniref:Cyclic nucleotide-binding domain-containing protein n=1 Tax=Paramecium tetraurelia TaxID=5888 RepID=A0C849_PARTE|nr:uncharacterized protein GSPATT00036097001 [Paramecium tetraurelia]CAK66966.1 unnamed protein product [Paramecium tetraurelia]|eukprot:XP_001434363.1 hypothetical protein (macronuclear) [Paramecium tetraurelia strain d4-2]